MSLPSSGLKNKSSNKPLAANRPTWRYIPEGGILLGNSFSGDSRKFHEWLVIWCKLRTESIGLIVVGSGAWVTEPASMSLDTRNKAASRGGRAWLYVHTRTAKCPSMHWIQIRRCDAAGRPWNGRTWLWRRDSKSSSKLCPLLTWNG
jgi:hypothetical protein